MHNCTRASDCFEGSVRFLYVRTHLPTCHSLSTAISQDQIHTIHKTTKSTKLIKKNAISMLLHIRIIHTPLPLPFPSPLPSLPLSTSPPTYEISNNFFISTNNFHSS